MVTLFSLIGSSVLHDLNPPFQNIFYMTCIRYFVTALCIFCFVSNFCRWSVRPERGIPPLQLLMRFQATLFFWQVTGVCPVSNVVFNDWRRCDSFHSKPPSGVPLRSVQFLCNPCSESTDLRQHLFRNAMLNRTALNFYELFFGHCYIPPTSLTKID